MVFFIPIKPITLSNIASSIVNVILFMSFNENGLNNSKFNSYIV